MEEKLENETSQSNEDETHSDAYVFSVIAFIGYGLYFSYQEFYPFDLPLNTLAAVLSWLGLSLAGLILILIATFPEAFDGAVEELFGSGQNNDFNPKGIFDHIRNYIIAGTFYYSGTLLLSSQKHWVLVYAVTVCLLGIIFVYLNYKHGKREVSKFLDKAVDVHSLTGIREKIWKTGIPKWPIYLFLPVLSTSGFMHVYILLSK